MTEPPASSRSQPGTDPVPDGGQGPPEEIRAFVVTRNGDSVEAGVGALAAFDLGPGDVLIDVAWSAVNYKDGMVTLPGNRVARRFAAGARGRPGGHGARLGRPGGAGRQPR